MSCRKATTASTYGIRFSPSKRGVVGAAPYRVCANIVGAYLVLP